ncbi:BlaI/MecI/CopY family transcriptional regulator [Uniformispora flossi]|uniref:BlaI/MecI/CopY family transcriptional regulator n=1 Tax=Uniformispora flossi TaxID=3390723 RepID=UPI003C2D56F8
MDEAPRVQGGLQAETMTVLRRIGAGTVEQVRGGLPEGSGSAYPTVRTVPNRLAERGPLVRASAVRSASPSATRSASEPPQPAPEPAASET